MKKLLFLLVLGMVTTASAFAGNGEKGFNNGDKTDKGTKAKTANRLEEFIWTLPQSARAEKVEENDVQKAIVDLYKWYLQNETRINNSSSATGDESDNIVAPFKVDRKVLQQYLKFIKKNFPGLNEEDLADKRNTTSARKTAPVSYSPDLDAPVSLSASK
ncbi:hypothetical protein EGT74_10615 [Chitinophaga lutea]|uniref:DUF4844 domain-containing protein n=1 Tax=Chitinophaga lutea TaxID=2488634 RepID=A0A3N4QD93_9BACT|nr:hypothetical protein [Chitinophaga lutea]RPE13937.1 hypothetical protein EGT74_10615 [Chitinophaga lutea]